MAGPRTASFGRILSTFGWVWMLGALITTFLVPDVERVPFLPGLALYLLGRTLTALGKRDTPVEGDDAGNVPARSSPRPEADPQAPANRPVERRNEYLDDRIEPTSRRSDEAFEIPDLEDAILNAPPPMTSEEMVAEARRRFAPRPPDYES